MSSVPLADVLARQGVYAPSDAARLLVEVALRLDELHNSGWLHRDLDLVAIAVDDDGRVELTVSRQPVRLAGMPIDLDRRPPELSGREPVEIPGQLDAARESLLAAGWQMDPRRIDLYQLGAVAVRLLSGDGVSSYLRSSSVKARVPENFQTVVDRALGFEAEARYESAAQVAADLRPLMDDLLPDERAADARPADVPFARLKQFRLIRRLGSGGMGDVYEAHDESLDRKVAVKVLPAELAKHEDFLRRFRSEATAAGRLAHPHIVPIHFIGEDSGRHFFAMQLVEGESLAARLARQPLLPRDEALDLVEQTLMALGAAHAHGLIHRDVKPGNILLDRRSGRALLADFGLVRRIDNASRMTATGMIMGTVDYIAPEQARGRQVDHRADLYSLGVLAYQLLAGRLPFEADTPTAMMFQHAYEQPTPLAELTDVSPGLSQWVNRLMAKNADDRYQTCEGALDDLRAVRRGEPIAAAALPDASIDFGLPDLEPRSPGSPRQVGSWQRLKDRAASLFHVHAPDALRALQNTQQQIDGAVDHSQRRRDRLSELVKEADSVVRQLNVEAQQCAQVFAEAATPEQRRQYEVELGQLNAQAAEQSEQADDLRLQLAQADAQVARLRSQRDALMARLRMAQAQLDGERRPRSNRRMLAVTVLLGLVAVGVIALAIPREPPVVAKVELPQPKQVEPIAIVEPVEVPLEPEPPAAKPVEVYLDDLQEQDYRAAVLWGLGKHGHMAGSDVGYFRGRTLTHSLFLHGSAGGVSQVVYPLDGRYHSFRGIAGMLSAQVVPVPGGPPPTLPPTPKPTASSPVVFKVWGDGKLLWESPPIQENDDGADCDVSVSDVQKLRLEVHCAGSQANCWSTWIDPRLVRDDPDTVADSPQAGKN